MWFPAYRLEGLVKGLTAIISICTAILMIPIMPKALAFPSMTQLIEQLSKKSQELTQLNEDLEKFKYMALGREDRVIELKKEVNELAKELGRTGPYHRS